MLLPSHLAGALDHMVALLRLKDLVHVATVNPLAPALSIHQVHMVLLVSQTFLQQSLNEEMLEGPLVVVEHRKLATML